jgi:zinc transport system substrate-binding protein
MARLVFFLCLLGFIVQPPESPAAELNVYVSILPQKAFVQAIGGDHIQVQVMVQPGANPATYEPKPSQLACLADSKIYFAIGVPFEKAWLKRFRSVQPKLQVVHIDQNISKMAMPSAYQLEPGQHQRTTGQNRQTQSKDPHIWLSPPLVKTLAQNICRALAKADPEQAMTYRENLSTFLHDIESLDADLQAMLTPFHGYAFLVFHPAWGYFARTYDLRQVAVEVEGKSPKPQQLARLIAFARKENIQAIFVQPQFSAKSARTIAREIGAEVIAADPLAEDWAANLRRQAKILSQVLADRSGT